MTRNFKALGLAAFALLALGAMVAPAAQAEVTLTTGLTPSTHTATSLHATQYNPTGNITDNNFTTAVGATNCSNALSTFTGTTTGTNKTLTITPNYVHCTTITKEDKAGTPVTVTLNGCDFLFNQPETLTGGPKYTGTVSVICPAGKKIEVEVYAAGSVTAHSVKICTLSIGETKNIAHVIYTNIPGVPPVKDDITVKVTGSGIPYSTTGICGETAGNATYTSSLTLTSTNPAHDIWFSD